MAGSGWAAFAHGGVGLATAIACGTAWVLAALWVPWIAATAPSPPAIGPRMGACSAASIGGVGLAMLPAVPSPGAVFAQLASLAVLFFVVTAFWTSLVVAGRIVGWRPVTAQAGASLVALAQCTTPCVAEALVAAVPQRAGRAWVLDLVHGANPLLVTGRDILGWDVWHLPWLYARADVAGYGTPQIGWVGSAVAHALAGLAVFGFAVWRLRRQARRVATQP